MDTQQLLAVLNQQRGIGASSGMAGTAFTDLTTSSSLFSAPTPQQQQQADLLNALIKIGSAGACGGSSDGSPTSQFNMNSAGFPSTASASSLPVVGLSLVPPSASALSATNGFSSLALLRSNLLDDAANTKFLAKSTETAVNGFSDQKFTNPFIPSYIPPECFELESGELLKAFLARCAIHDFTRLSQEGLEASYFANVELPTRFDSKGNRVNVPQELLSERNQKNLTFLKDRIARYRNESVRDGERSKKYCFTAEEIPLIGALFGARGETQKWLVKESGVLRIEFAGKGLTKRQKRFNATKGSEKSDALENDVPHAFVVGYDDTAVSRAIELIRWFLSDQPDAVAKREENRRRLAEKDGTYDAATWRPKETVLGEKRERDHAGVAGQHGLEGESLHAFSNQSARPATLADDVKDEEMDNFLDDML